MTEWKSKLPSQPSLRLTRWREGGLLGRWLDEQQKELEDISGHMVIFGCSVQMMHTTPHMFRSARTSSELILVFPFLLQRYPLALAYRA